VGQKHIKTADRKENIATVNGLIRESFAKQDVSVLSHGPGLIFDFENSIRRSKTETPRYEFKQGILRLAEAREVDITLLQSRRRRVCSLAIVDKPRHAARVKQLDGVDSLKFEHVEIVGIREAKVSL
jgi:hypothetical protein